MSNVQAIEVANRAFRMTEDEIVTFEFDFTKLVPTGISPNGQSARIERADNGIDVSDDCLIGVTQRTGNIVKQVVANINSNTSYILVLVIWLANSNKRAATITIEGYV